MNRYNLNGERYGLEREGGKWGLALYITDEDVQKFIFDRLSPGQKELFEGHRFMFQNATLHSDNTIDVNFVVTL